VIDLARIAAPFVLLGTLLGALHFALLRYNVGAYVGGAGLRAVGLHLARIALVGAAFTLTARVGALPLLATLAGFVLARFPVMRMLR
jgi:hypothetical protein